MLSNVDITKELNKNIFIYPLTPENIRGTTVNLKASEWAWSLKSKSSIVSTEKGIKNIIIQPHDTGLIETEEVIYTKNNIAGTYHSKVKQVSYGMGHIGTTLDPLWCGNSLIAIHNHSDEICKIKVGETFASLIFYYLNSNTTTGNTNTAGQTEVLKGLKINQDQIPSELEAEWRKDPSEIIKKCNQKEELDKLRNMRKKFGKPFYKNKICILIAFPVLIILIGVVLNKLQLNSDILKWYTSVGLSGVVATYFSFFVNYLNK